MSDLWGILLAAGSSTRFAERIEARAAGQGCPGGGFPAQKLLQPVDNRVPLGIAAARALLRALPNSIAVVRDDRDELAEQLRAEAIGLVVNPRAEEGMGTSLACGVRATAHATGWVIALADMPWIQTETIAGVARMLRAGAPIAAPVYQGRRGHPVGFSHEFRAELEALGGDHGARELLERHAARVQLFEVDDPGILRDVDTPSDLAPD